MLKILLFHWNLNAWFHGVESGFRWKLGQYIKGHGHGRLLTMTVDNNGDWKSKLSSEIGRADYGNFAFHSPALDFLHLPRKLFRLLQWATDLQLGQRWEAAQKFYWKSLMNDKLTSCKTSNSIAPIDSPPKIYPPKVHLTFGTPFPHSLHVTNRRFVLSNDMAFKCYLGPKTLIEFKTRANWI